MHDRFELFKRFRRSDHPFSEYRPVHGAIAYRPWEHRLDQLRRFTRVQIVDNLISVVHGNTVAAEIGGHRALAHAHRACEPSDNHVEEFSRSAMASSTAWRSPGVTSGRTPNHFSKPGTA